MTDELLYSQLNLIVVLLIALTVAAYAGVFALNPFVALVAAIVTAVAVALWFQQQLLAYRPE